MSWTRAGGFTLLEVMIALAVLTVSLLGCYAMILSCVTLSHTSRETNIAMFDLEAALEQVISTPFDDIPIAFPDGEPVAEFNGLHLADELITISYVDPDAEPLEIAAAIAWTDHRGAGTRRLTLKTARTR